MNLLYQVIYIGFCFVFVCNFSQFIGISVPSEIPTTYTKAPTPKPTLRPTLQPSNEPRKDHSFKPTNRPTKQPSNLPTQSPPSPDAYPASTTSSSSLPSNSNSSTLPGDQSPVEVNMEEGESNSNEERWPDEELAMGFALVCGLLALICCFIASIIVYKQLYSPTSSASDKTKTRHSFHINITGGTLDVKEHPGANQLKISPQILPQSSVSVYSNANSEFEGIPRSPSPQIARPQESSKIPAPPPRKRQKAAEDIKNNRGPSMAEGRPDTGGIKLQESVPLGSSFSSNCRAKKKHLRSPGEELIQTLAGNGREEHAIDEISLDSDSSSNDDLPSLYNAGERNVTLGSEKDTSGAKQSDSW